MPNIGVSLSPLNAPGQIGRGLLGRRAAAVLLLFALGIGGVGCHSIYQTTQAMLPPEPYVQLECRIAEAQQAEQLARQAMVTWRDRFHQGWSDAAIETDGDRVAATAFEFDRRVAAARDAAAYCEAAAPLDRELDRLQQRSGEMLEYVQAMRREGNSPNTHQLDEFLRGSAKP